MAEIHIMQKNAHGIWHDRHFVDIDETLVLTRAKRLFESRRGVRVVRVNAPDGWFVDLREPRSTESERA